MQYLLLILAVALLWLAWLNSIKYRKLKNSGKIPRITSTRRNIKLYLLLSLTMFFAYIFIVTEIV
jgi:hypothetical protein